MMDLSAVPDTPERFYDLPYPSDVRLTSDGAPDLAGFPHPEASAPVAQLLSLVAETRGFSVVPTVLFRFDGPIREIDPLRGPTRAGEDASLWLLDLDDGGRSVPVVAQTLAEDAYTPSHVLALQPAGGHVLRGGHRHAAIVMRSHRDAQGELLGVPEAVARLAKEETPEGALAPRLTDLSAPLWPMLAARGIPASEVAAFTVFTTGDAVAETASMSERVRERFSPVIEDLAVDADDGLSHERFCELHGTISLPQFQEGTPPFDTAGRFLRDQGDLVVLREEQVPVVLTVPRQPMPAGGFPVVVWAHGSSGVAQDVVDRGPVLEPGGERQRGLGPAHVLAAEGLSTVAMSALLGADRLDVPRDRAYLNLANLAAYTDTWRQAMLETRLLLDALERLRIPADVVADCEGLRTGGGDLVLDLSGGMLMGQSAGAHLITEVAAIDPRVRAIVPTGGGGFWSELLAGGSRVGGPPELFALALGTSVRLSTLHPGLALLQHAWEAAEPLVHAPRVSVDPLPGHPVRQVFMPASADDGYFPEPIYDAMAVALGVELAGPVVWSEMVERLTEADLTARPDYPVVDNRASGGAAWTGVVVQWEGDDLVDSHNVFAQQEGLKHQYACFFSSWQTSGRAAVVAPEGPSAPCEAD